jgi:hypothetical protein
MRVYFKPDGIWIYAEDLNGGFDIIGDGDWGKVEVPDDADEEQIETIVNNINNGVPQ